MKRKGQAQKFQVVTIRLSDGSSHSFVGLAFTEDDDKREVTGFSISDPMDLPPGVAELIPGLTDTGDGVFIETCEEQ
ncbi:MAG: hypothetical protein HYX78_03120 [Armatimonadetes bacterium]|nr:hypothetical protein [Armatimonadota bacterium]